ncbi:MAG TPA: universal stress protein, partial [Rhizomicrobium sp.]|nr:universal stress protein [Rhizomicrobium sp.]
MSDTPAPDQPESLRHAKERVRKFLVVVDKSPECHVALRFAARRAQATSGRVTLLCVTQPGDYQQWRGVEEIMKDEAHQEAEQLLHTAAKAVNELSGIMSELVILDGRAPDSVL